MNPWEQRVNQSPALSQARELRSQLGAIDTKEQILEDQQGIERIQLVNALLISRLENLDPMLVSEGVLNNLNSYISNLLSYVTTWTSSKDPVYIRVHSQNMVDSILAALGQLPQVDLPGAREAISQLRSSVNGYRMTVSNQIKAAEADLEGISKQASQIQQTIANLSDSIAETQTQQQTAFNKSETERSTAFNKLLSDKQSDLEGTLKALNKQATKFVSDVKENIASTEREAEDAKARIEKIMSIVGDEALIGEYSKNADKDRAAANLWRWITVGAILFTIAGAGWLAWESHGNKMSWQELAAKALLTLSFSALAGYAGRQSGEHRKSQREAEQMSLQLAAVKPYLADMDDITQRDGLLVDIAKKLFGKAKVTDKSPRFKIGKREDDPTLVGQLLNTITELLKSKDKP